MSDSQEYEGTTVSTDGLTVDKRFEEDEFPVPAIAFEIRSDRAETVTITLVDDVPDGVAVEDLGFHPEYGSEYWTIEEEEITFEREIEAGSEYTTVYGIRATGTDNVDQFLEEPRIAAVEPPLEEGSVVDSDSSDVVRDIISGDSESVPGLDEDEEDVEDVEDIETLDLKDPNEAAAGSGGTATTGNTTGEASVSAGGPGDADSDVGSVTGALAAEIRNGAVDAEDVELLRKAFELVDGESGSTEARIKRLQTQVADLQAYTDALEEFLDENGVGDEMIEEFRERVESFESELEGIRALAEGQDEAVSSLEADVEAVQSSMDDLESDVESALADVKSVENGMDEVSGEVEDVSDEIEEVSERIDDLEERVGGIDVDEIETQVSDIEEDIQDLKEWRDQLSSVIGG